jgi:hypothetical protein
MNLEVDVGSAGAQIGDTLLVVIARVGAVTPPAGWVTLAQVGSGMVLDVFARAAAPEEPDLAVFAGGAEELQGQLIVLRGGGLQALVESSGHASFAIDTNPPSPAGTSQQAINLVLSVWSASGNVPFLTPTGYTLIDLFSTSEVTTRTLLIAYRLAGATGTVPAIGADTGGGFATGDAWTLVLRDRAPFRPRAFADLTAGNIGLRRR